MKAFVRMNSLSEWIKFQIKKSNNIFTFFLLSVGSDVKNSTSYK